MKVLLILAAAFFFTACDARDHPISQCISFGHEIEECIELAKVMNPCECKCKKGKK